MNDILVVMVSHNELTRRGEHALRRSLASVMRARDVLARARPGIDVYIACCDDASSDGTAEYIEGRFAGRSGCKLVHHQVNSGPGFSRNVAAAQFKTDIICMLDADDEYKENHLAVCSDLMARGRNQAGKKIAVWSTTTDFNVEVHPDWVTHISITIPLTKAVRRFAWDFVEGMPTTSSHNTAGGQDLFFMEKVTAFFPVGPVSEVTTRYYNYPGSFFDRQLHKFRKSRAQYKPADDFINRSDLEKSIPMRHVYATGFLQYLQSKWELIGGKEKFQDYSLNQSR